MKFNVSDIYKDRLEVIEQQQRQARLRKDWISFYRLKAEKKRLQQTIKNPPIIQDRGR